ncbi:Zn(II)2Cys6 transcription factor [Aspergillus ambiguus]|uniref:Zn(II)2Cys6 transcription factor n=1 Tax=Aspergillus ambiguus TaxID=176160 RepID=UPI003CCE415C
MMSPEADSGHRPMRTRARQACIHCNRRRIRCNVLEMRPCQNCRTMNVPCEVGVSKRGKYPRKKSLRHNDTNAASAHEGAARQSSSILESPIAPNPGFSPPCDSLHAQSEASQAAQQILQLRHPGGVPSAQHVSPRPAWVTSQDPADAAQQTVFLGESSPLTCVIDEGRRSPEKGSASAMQRARLHYPIPERLDANSSRDEAVHAHKAKMEMNLSSDGAFSYPPSDTCRKLLNAYFVWFHPCFPILDRHSIQQSYASGTISPLLLQSMLFIGVSLCTDAVFAQTEFTVRYRAKFLFYSRAKAIYDADWESNKTVKLQSLFMLSFWRGGPSEERDTRFWLGIAISLAQKRGMHVMSKFSFQSAEEERLWKRIWWALYIRDQQSAAALGLPPRIRDEDCDVAMLQPDDIREYEGSEEGAETFDAQTTEDIFYPVEMAKLAKLLRAIVSTQYLPMQSAVDPSSRDAMHRQLCDWEQALPHELKLDNAESPRALFLAGLLHMTHSNLYILLYRSLFLRPSSAHMERLGRMALEAATKSTRIIEDMLSHNLVQHGPTHLITHAFSTLCIHTIHCRRTTGTTRKLAEHRARLSLLGLQELQKSWDLENWVLDLFFRCLDDGTARTLRLNDVLTSSQISSQQENNGAVDHSNNNDATTPNTTIAVPDPDPYLAMLTPTLSNMYTDLETPGDLFGLFNFADNLSDVPPTQDSLNLQNLESLYRFL